MQHHTIKLHHQANTAPSIAHSLLVLTAATHLGAVEEQHELAIITDLHTRMQDNVMNNEHWRMQDLTERWNLHSLGENHIWYANITILAYFHPNVHVQNVPQSSVPPQIVSFDLPLAEKSPGWHRSGGIRRSGSSACRSQPLPSQAASP